MDFQSSLSSTFDWFEKAITTSWKLASEQNNFLLLETNTWLILISNLSIFRQGVFRNKYFGFILAQLNKFTKLGTKTEHLSLMTYMSTAKKSYLMIVVVFVSSNNMNLFIRLQSNKQQWYWIHKLSVEIKEREQFRMHIL